MNFEERMAARMKRLQGRSLTAAARQRIIEGAMQTKPRSKRRWTWGPAAAALVACLVVAAAVWEWSPFSLTPKASIGQFQIVVPENQLVSTPLDTTDFRSVVADYLQHHRLSNVDHQPEDTSPVNNHIADLAVRWSDINAGKYGYALVSFLGNGQPGIAAVMTVKNGLRWNIADASFFPEPSASYAKQYAIYPMAWGGTGIARNDDVQYEFLAGLIINRAITHVVISRKDGWQESIGVVNGVFGFARTVPKGQSLWNGGYTIRGYDKNGKLLFQQG